MNFLVLTVAIAVALALIRSQQERRRIAILAGYLGRFQIERLMETLSTGYMRALGEDDPLRQEPVWNHMRDAELRLAEQVQLLAVDIARADALDMRVSTLGLALPFADRLFPAATFDLRKALAIHARGVHAAVHGDPGQAAKSRAFTISAEFFLLQHTCHWFCKGRSVASARMLVRHKTRYEQLLTAVTPDTARAYQALLAG